jgi:DNA repair exonuclease SbcCD ATPase subunit
METVENNLQLEIQESLFQIKQYLEKDIEKLLQSTQNKEAELKTYKEQLENARQSMEGNRQLINKLLGDLSKLQNDLDWYKRTFEKRSLLGTIREKIFKKK